MKKILLLSAALLLTTTIGFTEEKISQQKTDVEAAGLNRNFPLFLRKR